MSDPVSKTGTTPVSTQEISSATSNTDTKQVSVEETSQVRATRQSGDITASKDELQQSSWAVIAKPPDRNGAKNDAYATIAAISNLNGNPSELLGVLSNQVSNSSSTAGHFNTYQQELNQELNRQSADLGTAQHRLISSRLSSRKIEALQQALLQGVGNNTVQDSKLTKRVLLQINRQFENLKTRFGAEPAAGEAITKKEVAEARKGVDAFIQRFNNGLTTKSEHLDAKGAAKISKATEILSPEGQAQLPVSKTHPEVCKLFLADMPRGFFGLVSPDGSREWLVSKSDKTKLSPDDLEKKAVNRLVEFCGGDKQRTLELSRILNQSVLFIGAQDNIDRSLGLPNVEDQLGNKSMMLSGSNNVPIYEVKATGDGAFNVTASNHSPLDLMHTTEGNLTPLNQNVSSWSSSVYISLSNEGKTNLEGVDYSLTALPQLGNPIAATFEQQPDQQLTDFARQKLNIPLENDLIAMPHNSDTILQLTNDTSAIEAKIESLKSQGVLSESQATSLSARLELLSDTRSELAKIDTVSAQGAQQYMERAGDLGSDLRLLQQDLVLKAEVWSSNLPKEQAIEMNSVITALSATLGTDADAMELLTADYQAALDDARGNLDGVAMNSKLSRLDFANRQADALAFTASAMFGRAMENGIDVTENHFQLLSEIQNRRNKLATNLAAAQRGEVEPMACGAGARKQKLTKLSSDLAKSIEQGHSLPETHSDMSEAQLMQVRVDKFFKDNPEFSNYKKTFDNTVAHEFKTGLDRSNWTPISNTFHDIDSNGKLRQLNSTITPAPYFEDPIFASSYGGKGVASHSRMGGLHVSNLANSQLTNSHGEVMFSGLRHGILDSYTLTAENLSNAPKSVQRNLLINVLQNDKEWKNWMRAHGGGNVEADINLIQNDPEAAKVSAEAARKLGNINAAKELATAAVINNPVLLEVVRNGNPVTVNLDSYSLITPDILRDLPIVPSESEREMITNQRAALDAVAQGPLTITIEDDNGNPQPVEVTLKPRAFNFAVNKFGIDLSGASKILKPTMGWDAADAINKPLLEELVGPLNSDEIGGQAGEVLARLENGEAPPLAANAFYDPTLRAQAIREFSTQVKQIFNSKSHREAGLDPYKLPARLALLSNLVGNSTAYNCKSGKDRTGQLDAEVKYLATNAAAGVFLQPDISPDRTRKTNFALKTGNLEMQQYNSGLAGYKLNVATLFEQVTSPLAEKLYLGDSALVGT